jgi:NADPH2:quinone reductase
VLLKASAIGANFADTRFRRGGTGMFTRPLPGSITGDVVGTVESVGPGVDTGLIGRRVAALVPADAFADYSVAGADWLAEVPEGIDDASATTLPMAAPLALSILRMGRLAAGETVLVHAAAGGIGHLVTQLAKHLGGKVIATVGSPSKREFARAHGADEAVDYRDPSWPERLPDGVDVVLDSVGGAVLDQSIGLLRPFGRAVVYGAAAGDLSRIPVESLFGLKTVTGYSLLAWRAAAPKAAAAEVAEVTAMFVAGQLRTTVHTRLPLTDAAEAHRVLDEREQAGRVLLVP